MKKQSSVLLVLLGLLIMAGCATTATLYPVQGPLAQQASVQTIEARVDGIMGNSGKITLTMPDGEVCKGRWSSVAPAFTTYSSAQASGSVSSGLANVWASVYGNGFAIGNVAGVNRGQAVLMGTRGAVIQVEFLTGSGTANGYGVAVDNKGNTYKVLF